MKPNTEINRAKLEIAELDHWQCRNPNCEYPTYMIAVHRIIFASHGGAYTLTNGVTLCALCHGKSEGKYNPKDKDGNRITGDKYLLIILNYWKGKLEDRWEVAREHLKQKIKRKLIYAIMDQIQRS